MNVDILGIIAIATSLIGFITVWVKIGIEKGRKEEVINMLVKKTPNSRSKCNENLKRCFEA